MTLRADEAAEQQVIEIQRTAVSAENVSARSNAAGTSGCSKFTIQSTHRTGSRLPLDTMRHVDAPGTPESITLGSRRADTHLVSGDTEEIAILRKRVEYLRSELVELRTKLGRHREERRSLITGVAVDEDAVFILTKIAEEGKLHADVLAANLTAPDGWLAFAKLARANLVKCYEQLVIPTDTGLELLAWLQERWHNSDTAETSQ